MVAALLIAGGAVWPAPRYESGDQLPCTPGVSYNAVRFDGLKVGGWSADRVGGGSDSGTIFIYPLVVLRTQADSHAVWFRTLASPLSRGCNLDLR